MANGYFERGEVYWVRMDNGFGGEQGVGRPGLIISRDSENSTNDTVTIAFLTTKFYGAKKRVEIEATGTTSYVVHNQIMTYDKSRLGKCIGMLNSAEQKAVDDVLETYLDLGYVDDAALKQKDGEIADRDTLIGDLRNEVAGAAAEIAKRDEEIASLRMEIEMWQKCYGRCMDMLVDTKVNGDLSRRVAAPTKVVDSEEPVITPKHPEPPKEPEQPEVEDNRLDINSCTATALKKIGFSLAMARKIVEHRPFKNVEDLKRVNGLKGSQYRIMEPKLCCKPITVVEKAPEKVEFVKDGPDPGYEVEQSEATAPVMKVNVNTATAKEIHEITGMNLTQAYRITSYRKQNGPYATLDDLVKAPNVFAGTIAKCRDKLEV